MSEYEARVSWTRNDAAFLDRRYSRAHTWFFDGGASVPASSSPHSVRLPMSDPANVDPEEALVASASSCHMLWFLSLAAEHGFVVDSYTDSATGYMEKDDDGRIGITRIVLRPDIVFSGAAIPSAEEIRHLHHLAHENCYIANSLRSEIIVASPA
ncbi:MAG: OsmC family protein [Bacteroidetes bacterium]|nr:OsmC family protein [Bacteroidota bacterium]